MNRRASVAIHRCPDYRSQSVEAALADILRDLGGMDRFIAPGDTVLLKPNLLSPRPPEQAVTTHPSLVAAVARVCLQAGAGMVWLGDSCAGDHDDRELWQRTGMTAALAGLPVEFKSFNRAVATRPLGASQAPVPVWLDQVDKVISLPKLKTHALTLLTCAVKNMYGMIAGSAKSAYHATHPSPRAMSRFLAEVFAEFKPDLTIVDAVIAMEGDGPANGRPKPVGLLLASPDAVAVDAVCAGFLGLQPQQIPLLAETARRGCGIIDHARIDILGVRPEELTGIRLRPSVGRLLMRIPEPVFKIATRLIKCQPIIDHALCIRCGICQKICSRQAIKPDRHGNLRIDPARCIVCMCCAESCPRHAVATRMPFARLRSLLRRQSRRPPEKS